MALNETLAVVTACPVPGNADLYGLGNRLGIYFQMLTVQFSSLISAIIPIEDRVGQSTVVFILATTTVLLRLISSREIEPVEVVPILGLIYAQIGVCRVPFSGSKITLLIYAGELIGILALFTWFWWKGIDMLPRSCKNDYAFFFAKVSIWGWFRRMNKALSIISVVGAGLSWFMNLSKFLYLVVQHAMDAETLEGLSSSTHPIEITVNIGIIVFVEVSLRWNGITGVHSLRDPGQFMPLFIALAQLVYTIYQLVNAFQEYEGHEDWYSTNDSKLECEHKRSSSTRGDVENIALDQVPGAAK
ncbi:hypothetical protein B0J13DRAFT_332467 [Dactylonectria estremocensis]|uniref:Uncharacterized protein n=1 Tax=Dactylonectria estremocensis TaxID=1079267 RepID=A0A9P9EWM0_9HYPO|nr:hypothetical protein B0J13DRAFT_332467 [Dactylonectria estremocensis]